MCINDSTGYNLLTHFVNGTVGTESFDDTSFWKEIGHLKMWGGSVQVRIVCECRTNCRLDWTWSGSVFYATVFKVRLHKVLLKVSPITSDRNCQLNFTSNDDDLSFIDLIDKIPVPINDQKLNE